MSNHFRSIEQLERMNRHVRTMPIPEQIKLLKKLIEYNFFKKKKYSFVLNKHRETLDILNYTLYCQTIKKKQLKQRIDKMTLHINIIDNNIHIFQNKLTDLYHKLACSEVSKIDFIKYKIDNYLHLTTHDIFDAVNNMFKHIVNINNITICHYQDDEWYLFDQTECIGNPTLYCCSNKYDIKITLYNKSFRLITITLNELYQSNPHIIHKIMLQEE